MCLVCVPSSARYCGMMMTFTKLLAARRLKRRLQGGKKPTEKPHSWSNTNVTMTWG
jgi:hypothetical protein